jgi:hypothetical protein
MKSYKRIKIPVTTSIDKIVAENRVNHIELIPASKVCDCCYDWYDGETNDIAKTLYTLYVNGELITDHYTATDVDISVLLDALNIRYSLRYSNHD